MKKVYIVLAGLVSMLALFTSNMASWAFSYQPKDPKCLNK